jgi:tetratricopeptide (TPR) repeat protein
MDTHTLFIVPPVIYGDVDYYLTRGLIDLIATSLDIYEGISAIAPIMVEVDLSGNPKRELHTQLHFFQEERPEEELLAFVERCFPNTSATLLPIMKRSEKKGSFHFSIRLLSQSGFYPLELNWEGSLLKIVQAISEEIHLIAEHCGGVPPSDSRLVWPKTHSEEALQCYLHGLALSKNYQAITSGNQYKQALDLLFRALDLDSHLEFSAFRIIGFAEHLIEYPELPQEVYQVGLESLYKLEHRYALSGRTQIFLAQAFETLDDPARAEKNYLRAYEKHPEEDLVCLEVGAFYEKQGKLTEAYEVYKNYYDKIPLDMCNPDILLNQGVILAKQNEISKAIHCWKNVLQLRPLYPIALGNLMNAYFDKKEYSLMWIFFELGLQAKTVPWKNYENILNYAGSPELEDFGPGLFYLENHLKKHPEDVYGYLSLAQVLRQTGQSAKARYWLNQGKPFAKNGLEKGYLAWQSLCTRFPQFEKELDNLQKDHPSLSLSLFQKKLEEWIESEPDFWQGLYLLGKIYQANNTLKKHSPSLSTHGISCNTFPNSL